MDTLKDNVGQVVEKVQDRLNVLFKRGGHVRPSKKLVLETREHKTLKKVLKVLHNPDGHMFSSVFYPSLAPGTCDYCNRERCANLITSIPFLFTGAWIMKNSKDERTRRWGASVIGAGCASGLFHSVLKHKKPRAKTLFRRIDYSTVCMATSLAVKAFQIPVPKHYPLINAFALPVNPFIMGAYNSGLIEYNYFRHAMDKPELRAQWAIHLAATAAAGTAFTLEDYKPTLPFTHATWHVAAALATFTVLPMAHISPTITLPIVGPRKSIDYPPTLSPKPAPKGK
mmetsp:Transcript_29304/g.64014  ORF Transcript_29304/g.64014 Transcript_29304/m.64014 type:complete len:284 (-) Transcript_29304:191-1042(-)|eukprot:CAMPEP_0118924750 /NCGR_PEP_ID=MMETSP1169-20130426/2739_1 /TAXON_ID=36882 /ORGANISM="Pyramimonas obovata, Strain CCMP722" /LENGTH=283 /DNA_ID=CAMNT_0006865881 /DNA_START=222 /DNA_END=1073 /DNA_ORIENTATION=+